MSSEPFTCVECGTVYPNHDFWNQDSRCDYCHGDWDYISWRQQDIKDEIERKRKSLLPKIKRIIKPVPEESFMKFIKERKLGMEYNQWLSEQKSNSKNSLKKDI